MDCQELTIKELVIIISNIKIWTVNCWPLIVDGQQLTVKIWPSIMGHRYLYLQNLDFQLFTVQIYGHLTINTWWSTVDCHEMTINNRPLRFILLTVDHHQPLTINIQTTNILNVKKKCWANFQNSSMLSLPLIQQKFKFHLKWYKFWNISDFFLTLGILILRMIF